VARLLVLSVAITNVESCCLCLEAEVDVFCRAPISFSYLCSLLFCDLPLFQSDYCCVCLVPNTIGNWDIDKSNFLS
jgi:hypothetical protein